MADSFHSQWKAKTKIDVTKIFQQKEWKEIALQSSYFTFTFTLSDRIMAAVWSLWQIVTGSNRFRFKRFEKQSHLRGTMTRAKDVEANWNLSKNNGINCVLDIKHLDRSGFECKSDLVLNIKCVFLLFWLL